jgi:RNA-directed DNA polymerase
MVQQALLQVLDPILDPLFSEFSYGFRQGRSCHQALQKAREYVEEGREYVVDMDLEKFFDNVNHDILMSRLAKHIGDKRILKIVRRFLQAGIMYNGVCTAGETGTPQGGPLSPLLANLLLDDLDKELERRGHKFVRYADDCNIYVRSEKAGERVMESVTQFLKEKLRLTVNRQKSAVSPCEGRTFLGYKILVDGRLVISEKSINRIKDKIRMITRRNRGVSLETIIVELNKIIPGWVQYFKLAQAKKLLTRLDEWLRRKIRCYRFKQLKKTRTKVKALKALGVVEWQAWIIALSGKGLWRLSGTPQLHQAMNLKWFKEQGLKSFLEYYESLISKC